MTTTPGHGPPSDGTASTAGRDRGAAHPDADGYGGASYRDADHGASGDADGHPSA